MHLRANPVPFQYVPTAVDTSGRHVPVSYWHETVDVAPGPELSEDLTCDVCIIGGGFTGLSTAYFLKRLAPDLDVVVLERGVVGHGASGRNGGFAMPLIGWDLLYCVERLGDEGAASLYRLMYEAVDHVKRTVAEHEIECDLEATGYLLLNTCRGRERRARREFEAAHRLGFDHEWLDKDALRAHIHSDQFRSGVFDPHPCVINPAKLARGLKTVTEKLGVQIYERTPLVELIDGRPVEVKTPRGRVKAKQVVLALNGYGASVGFLPRRVLPVHTYIILTAPLSDQQLAETGWHQKRASLETARNFIHYFRLTADNRILFGGEDAELYWRGRYFNQDESIFRALKARFHEYFPMLREIEFTHEWGGVLGVTLDMFPTFGTSGLYDSIYHGCGYSGHGVALSNYAGAILAPQILKDSGLRVPDAGDLDLPFFYNRLPAWLPPDPFRYAGLKAYRAALRAQDKLQRA